MRGVDLGRELEGVTPATLTSTPGGLAVFMAVWRSLAMAARPVARLLPSGVGVTTIASLVELPDVLA